MRIGAEASAVVGGTPLVAARPARRTGSAAGLRQARVLQSRRLGQGPDRGGDDRRGRRGGAGQARALGGGRADQRQHRDRPGDGLRGARLRADPDPAGGDEPRAGEAAARLRRRGAGDALAGRDERGGRPGRGDPRAAQGLHADAVLQPRQRRGPPAHHGGGDLARHRRRGRRLRRRRRHRGHDHRRRADAEGAGAGGAGRRGRAGQLAGPLRRRARPAQDPGDRRRLRARGARPLGDRRDRRGQRRGRAGDGAAGRPARRASWPGSRPAPTSRRRWRSRRGRRWPARGW